MYKQMSEWKKYIPNMQSVRNEESPELKRSCRDVRVKELEVINYLYFLLLQKKIKPPQRMQEKLVIRSVTSGVHRALLDNYYLAVAFPKKREHHRLWQLIV